MGAVTVNRDEVLRYLGYRRQEADDAVAELADTCLEELKRCTAAKYISRTFSMDIRGACVSFGGVAVHSDMLANHLEGCREVIAFAGTLGAQVDRLIHRYSQTTMSRAVVMQAAATAMLEAYCDEWMGELGREARERGLYLRAQFGPGYGDFSIAHQADMLALLDCGRRIGLTMTDSYMLTPTKSLTCLLGLTADAGSCHMVKCAACDNVGCAFRRV